MASKAQAGIDVATKKPRANQSVLNIDDVCRDIQDGMMLAEIARKNGLTRAKVSEWLSANPERSARARSARAAAAQSYEEQAFDLVTSASDPFELAKAKELAHHLRWRASKVNPREYGERQQVDASVDMQVTTFTPEQAAEMAKLAYNTKPVA